MATTKNTKAKVKKKSAKNTSKKAKAIKKPTTNKKATKKKNSQKKASNTKTKPSKSSTNKVTQELNDLAQILSGEMKLREKEEMLEEKKKEAKRKRRERMIEKIEEGGIDLQKDKETPKIEKVTQNIKLFEWDAPIRIKFAFEMRSFMIIVAITLIFIVYLAVLGHYGLMFAIIALLFLIYVAGATEPLTVTNRITARGIESLDKLYEWFMLENFWFSEKNGQHMLIVETKLNLPPRLILILEEKDRGAIFMLLQDKLLYKDIRKMSRLQKMNFGEYVPLEEI